MSRSISPNARCYGYFIDETREMPCSTAAGPPSLRIHAEPYQRYFALWTGNVGNMRGNHQTAAFLPVISSRALGCRRSSFPLYAALA